MVLTVVICLTLALLHPLIASAQGADTVAPVIEVEELKTVNAAKSQVFSARIVEERELRDATLYVRRAGQVPYEAIPMQAIGDTTYYSVTLQTDPQDLRAFEYYIQARDAGGNRTVSGYAFDPLIRHLNAPAPLPAQASSATQGNNVAVVSPPKRSENSNGRRILQIALGVLAAGAIAALVSSGDSDSDSATGTVPLTINLEGF